MVAMSLDLKRSDQIAGCTLLEPIGAGGESVVWSAIHSSVPEPIVVRLTPVDITKLEQAESLLQQAQILTTLEHSHVLPIYDTGIAAGHFYTVSRYCANGSLDRMMKKRKLSTVEVLLFAMQTALALNYVHNYRIVHRDLKPANIVLDINQHAYLTDFGVSEQLIKGITTTHQSTYGTAPYVSPEHRLGERVSPASDIYSFGIMMFEMLKGVLPWDGHRSLHQFQIRDPQAILPPLDRNHPREVHAVLQAMTKTNQEERIQSALEAYMMLHKAFESPDIRSTGAQPSARDVALTLTLRGRQSWITHPQQFPLRLTDLAYIDSQMSVIDRRTYPDLAAFMLHGALTFGYKVDDWWKELPHTYKQMELCERVLHYEKTPKAALEKLNEFSTDFLCQQLAPETWDRLAELTHTEGEGQRIAAQLLARLEA